MDKNLTEIIFLLDRSGSMSGLESDTIGGFNSFIKKQSSLGKTNLTTILFDDKYEILHNGIDASTVTLTKNEYFTRGTTALLDAVGKTIIDVSYRLSHLMEEVHPNKVIFVITTDGLENSSKEFSYEKIKQMISRQKEICNWEFIFMGANIDVAAESHKLGINPTMAFSYKSSSEGTKKMYNEVNHMVSELRLDQFKKPNDPLSKANINPDS
ncbi:MAG: VWA domain-containing protein [Clostridiales bacterium]|nr:VWA domain-containing protein [Clostridiales bacterium]